MRVDLLGQIRNSAKETGKLANWFMAGDLCRARRRKRDRESEREREKKIVTRDMVY